MSYLLTQMFLYMLVTFLLGLLLGWVLWRYSENDSDSDAAQIENERLRKELDACGNRSASLQADNDALRGEISNMQAPAAAAPVMTLVEDDPVEAVTVEQSKPEGLSGPRGGVADDLQLIKGVGPKMERLLHSLGYYHFDQIGAWSSSEVAWVDNNLEGFKGRVTRDDWQDQAKAMGRS